MTIGVLGSGVVGQVLSVGFAGKGHDVRLATRDVTRPEVAQWSADTGIALGTFGEVARWGDVLVLATKGDITVDLVRSLEPHLDGKVVLDATNPLTFATGLPALTPTEGSLGQEIQAAAPAARVVKAFNTVGSGLFIDPALPAGAGRMLIAGDDEGAKDEATRLLAQVGWSTLDLGGIASSSALEGVALAWILHGVRTGTWEHVIALLG